MLLRIVVLQRMFFFRFGLRYAITINWTNFVFIRRLQNEEVENCFEPGISYWHLLVVFSVCILLLYF